MIPHKTKNLTQDVSEELNLPKTLVEDLIEFYYKEVRTTLSQLKEPRINIDGLGQFIVRTTLVKNSIPRFKKMLETHDTSTFSAYFNKKMLEEKIELLGAIKEKIDCAVERKNQFKKEKNEKHSQINLAKPETDSGGNN
jgi:nucleoid DNA-binding protein